MALKMLPILVLIVLAANLSNSATVRRHQGRWEKQMRDYGLSFSNSTEENRRYARFETNLEKVEEWNNNPANTFKLAVNQFSHLDPEFIKSRILLPTRYHTVTPAVGARGRTTTTKSTTKTTTKSTSRSPTASTQKTTTIPAATTTNVNWTSKFVAIKDQGQCGSCYAFSAAGVIEAAYAIKYGKTISLSEEQIIDCTYNSRVYGNLGCGGGYSDTSLEYAQSSPLYSTADFPYVSGSTTRNKPAGTCKTISNPTISPVSVTSTGSVGSTTEAAVAAFVKSNGPVTAYIDATNLFQLYSSGVFTDSTCSKTSTNHAVIIVGYGTTTAGKDYWIIRNSWGTTWGMSGYMLLARNQGGMCGIVTENYYATVK